MQKFSKAVSIAYIEFTLNMNNFCISATFAILIIFVRYINFVTFIPVVIRENHACFVCTNLCQQV